MEKANVEISRLADEFIRESKTIKTKSEFLYKLGEYERRILESQKPWHPTAQI
jgi:hypothetical protein